MNEAEAQTKPVAPRVALGVSGGIAAYKAVEILRSLQRAGCEVRVAMTRHACEFIAPLTFRAISGADVVVDDYAPGNPDPIAHITFSQSADLLLVAPATANIIAKFANGVADDFLSTTYLACKAPVLIAPAMNTAMWEHPATQRNLAQLRRDGVVVIEPDAGEMACGTFGPGRLSEPQKIAEAALSVIGARANHGADLSAERILITAGATREAIDPVRFISNRSSGRMGFALAQAARDRGASVTVVAGVTSAEAPAGVRILRRVSAEEMHGAVMKEFDDATVFIGAAAVADYRPKEVSASKIKKTADDVSLELVRTPDILTSVSSARPVGMLVVGFAAETGSMIENALEKLSRKDLDLIVANDVSAAGIGFDSEENAVTLLARDRAEPLVLAQDKKLWLAHRILDEIARLRCAGKVNAASAE